GTVDLDVAAAYALEGPAVDGEHEAEAEDRGQQEVVEHQRVTAEEQRQRGQERVPRLTRDMDAVRIVLQPLLGVDRLDVERLRMLLGPEGVERADDRLHVEVMGWRR